MFVSSTSSASRDTFAVLFSEKRLIEDESCHFKYIIIFPFRRSSMQRKVKERSMKKLPSGSGAKKIKDYYLKDVIQVITPFMKSKPQQGNSLTETKPSVNEENYIESAAETNNNDHSEEEITASVRNSQEKQKDIRKVVRTSQKKNLQTQAQYSNTAGIGPSEKRRNNYS
ncbi:uncharacterized protein isoform X2 [Leptinotarsa decemlineata]|uniref:uncharacterized protein isoform X2 n=1 Tax=Leptinotarsa decemlineata TaxID=7539 RepID=UPI003D30C169